MRKGARQTAGGAVGGWKRNQRKEEVVVKTRFFLFQGLLSV